jgi:hypothetical protein
VIQKVLFVVVMFLTVEVSLRYNVKLAPPPIVRSTGDLSIVFLGDSVSSIFPGRLDLLLRSQNVKANLQNRYGPGHTQVELADEVGIAMSKLSPTVLVLMLGRSSGLFSESPELSILEKQNYSLLLRASIQSVKKYLQPIWNSISSEFGKQRDINKLLYFEMSNERVLFELEKKLSANHLSFESLEALFYIKLKQGSFGVASRLADLISGKDGDRSEAEFAMSMEKQFRQKVKILKDLPQVKKVTNRGCLYILGQVGLADNNLKLEEQILNRCLTAYPNSELLLFHALAYFARTKNPEKYASMAAQVGLAYSRASEADKMKFDLLFRSMCRQYLIFDDKLSALKSCASRILDFPPSIADFAAFLKIYRDMKDPSPEIVQLKEKVAKKMPMSSKYSPWSITKSDTSDSEIAGSWYLELTEGAPIENKLRIYPPLVDSIKAVCKTDTIVLVLQYPSQPLAPLREGLGEIPCVRYLDTAAGLRTYIQNSKKSVLDLFESDLLHLTEVGNDLIAQQICQELSLSGAFRNVDRQINCQFSDSRKTGN